MDKKELMENNIKVIGSKSPETAVETIVNKEKAEVKVEAPKTIENNQVADNIKVIGGHKHKKEIKVDLKKADVETKDNLKESEKVNIKSEADKKAAEEENPEKEFNVSFAGDDKKEKETNKPLESEREAVSMSAESVLQFLKSEYPDTFSEVGNLTELSKKEELADPVAAFQKYHKETGRGISDFYNLQKDWSKESDDATLREYYKMTSEGFSDDDIDTQMELIEAVDEDNEFNYSDDEIRKRKIERRRELTKAVKYMKGKSKEYETSLDNSTSQQAAPQPQTAEQIEKTYGAYWKLRDASLNKMESFDFSIGIGEVKIPISEEFKSLVSEKLKTENSFFEGWIQNGKLNTDSAVEDTLWAIPEIRKHLLAESAKQINAISIEDYSKKNRNVTLDKIPSKAKEIKRAGVQVFGGEKATGMGTPLINN